MPFHVSNLSQYFSALEAGEKLTFNSATNTMGPRKFLHYGNFKKVSISQLPRFDLNTFNLENLQFCNNTKTFQIFFQTKSGKSLVAFLFNDFLLMATGSPSGTDFSFEKHHDIKLKVYRKVSYFVSSLNVFLKHKY